MAENKKSFLLYCDLIHTIELMPAEKAGELFLHILKYVNDQNPESKDIVLNLAFEPIKQQLKRDLKKYIILCNRNKTNGLKGGRPKNPDEPKKPNGYSGNPSKPRKADNDTDNDTDNDINKKGKKIPFTQSPIFLKSEFTKEFPDWPLSKKQHYYDAASSWSEEGNKKVNWKRTIQNWASRDEAEGKLKFSDTPKQKPGLQTIFI